MTGFDVKLCRVYPVAGYAVQSVVYRIYQHRQIAHAILDKLVVHTETDVQFGRWEESRNQVIRVGLIVWEELRLELSRQSIVPCTEGLVTQFRTQAKQVIVSLIAVYGIRRCRDKAQFPLNLVFKLDTLSVIIIRLPGEAGKQWFGTFTTLIPVLRNVVLWELQITISTKGPEIRLDNQQVFFCHPVRKLIILHHVQQILFPRLVYKHLTVYRFQAFQILLILLHQTGVRQIKRKQLPIYRLIHLHRMTQIGHLRQLRIQHIFFYKRYLRFPVRDTEGLLYRCLIISSRHRQFIVIRIRTDTRYQQINIIPTLQLRVVFPTEILHQPPEIPHLQWGKFHLFLYSRNYFLLCCILQAVYRSCYIQRIYRIF